ncbi:MAG: phosphoenolpyruvate kinase, partial [Bacteroidetes bacterium]|nr:phosphoenolpyruvate kinase [Bacteroidota bacterium]
MQLTAASVPGLALSDGIINTLPVPIHRAVAGKMLSEQQTLENSEAIQHAWRLNYQQMLRS